MTLVITRAPASWHTLTAALSSAKPLLPTPLHEYKLHGGGKSVNGKATPAEVSCEGEWELLFLRWNEGTRSKVRSLLAEPTSSKPRDNAPCALLKSPNTSAAGNASPSAPGPRRSNDEEAGCASQERTPPVHPRLTSRGSQQSRDGAGLGPGELTDERLAFPPKNVHRSHGRELPASPDPCHLQAQGWSTLCDVAPHPKQPHLSRGIVDGVHHPRGVETPEWCQ